MGLAQAAVKGTALFNTTIVKIRVSWRLWSLPVRHGRLAAPQDGLEGPVICAVFNKKNIIAFQTLNGLDFFETDRAQAFCLT